MASYLSWTPPSALQHPRIWINNVNGLTLTNVLLNRNAQGTGSGTPWANLVSYEAGHRSSGMDYYILLEYGLSHAAVWLLGEGVISSSERLAAGNRAVTVMLGIASAYSGTEISLPANNSTNRERMMMLGMMYDWMFPFSGFSDANKATIRAAIARFCARFLRCTSTTDATPSMDLTEFLWGHATEDACVTLVALSAMLNDGTPTENTRWQGWMDYLVDMMDDGNESRMFPAYNYFAKNAAGTDYDGGTYKGSGDYSYITKREEAMNRMFPCMASALGMTTIWTDQKWYQTWMHWILWHLRSDFHSHHQGESFQDAYFSHLTECHAMQTAQRNADTALGKACQWYHKTYVKNQLPGGTYKIWGPYYLWVILWEQAGVIQVPPFLDDMNSGWQSRIFEGVAKACFRTGWGARLSSDPASSDYNKLDQKYTSATFSMPRFFLGGHQIRDAGHFDLIVEGNMLFTKSGCYDGYQTLEYKHDKQILDYGRNPTQPLHDNIVWTRSGTSVTIYCTAHGYSAGNTIQTLNSSDTSALRNEIKTIQSVPNANSFVVTGLNAGATIGTCHFAYPNFASATYLTYGGPINTDPTGHRKCFQMRNVAHNCVGIHSVLEQSKVADGGNYENTYDDTLNFSSVKAGFAVMNDAGTVKTLLNCGDQLWPKYPPDGTAEVSGINMPSDLRDIVGAAKLAPFCKEGTYAHFSRGKIGTEADNRQYAYCVADLSNHYWSGKCTSYKRHFLWLGPNSVADWIWPVLVIWDDITCVPDATYGKKTCTFRLHTSKPYTGTAAETTFANGNSRAYLHMLLPAGVERTDVEGYKVGNVTLYAGDLDVLGEFGHRRDGTHDYNRANWDMTRTLDAGDHRAEWNPPANDADVDFMAVIFAGVVPHTSVPDVELVEDGDNKGVKFHAGNPDKELTVIFNESSPYGLSFEEDLPPAAPTGLSATVISQTRVDLNWADNAEDDLQYYMVDKATWSGTAWSDWSTDLHATGTTSAYSDTECSAGTTYRYRVFAVDDADQPSPYSDIVSVTTYEAPPVSATGAGIAPWRPSKRFSKYWLDLS